MGKVNHLRAKGEQVSTADVDTINLAKATYRAHTKSEARLPILLATNHLLSGHQKNRNKAYCVCLPKSVINTQHIASCTFARKAIDITSQRKNTVERAIKDLARTQDLPKPETGGPNFK